MSTLEAEGKHQEQKHIESSQLCEDIADMGANESRSDPAVNGEDVLNGHTEKGGDTIESEKVVENVIVESESVVEVKPTSTNEKDLNEICEQQSNEAIESELCFTGETDSTTESLPPVELIEEPHDRSDGSDSGLGSELAEERQEEVIVNTASLEESDSEISFLDRINESQAITNDAFEEFASGKLQQDSYNLPVNGAPNSPKSEDIVSLEHKTNEIENDIGDILKVTEPKLRTNKSSLKRKLSTDGESEEPRAKKKRGITFDSVTVYYFPRAQGFTCVPSQGGSTLGMGSQHSHMKKFSIVEHANEQRRIHRQLLQQIRSERNVATPVAVTGQTSSEESDSEDEPSDASESEMDMDNYYFLQPVPTRQRRALLRAAGVRKIDSIEKDECRDIRSSREFCGCGCKGYCDPDTCSCSQAGIKCQVDRLSFPCGCSRDNCGNSTGRIEFNPVRVRTHFIHTIMRLEMEKKQENEEDLKSDKKDAPNWMDNERLSGNYPKDEHTSPGKIGLKFNGNLLRDVSLNAHVEVENCVHNGSFTNLHYGAPGEGPGTLSHTPPGFSDLPAREDSLDLYTFREDCYGDETARDGSGIERKQQPSFPPPTQGFHFTDPRFSDVGFPAGTSPYPSPSNQYTQPYQSNFTDFSPVFNPYGGMYAPEFGTKPLEGSFQQPPNGYEHFVNDNFSTNVETKENQYTSLNPIGANNKMESFSDLLNGRYNYPGYPDETSNFSGLNPSDVPANNSARVDKCDSNSTNSTSTTEDCDENFGEIIKKSMVETVSA